MMTNEKIKQYRQAIQARNNTMEYKKMYSQSKGAKRVLLDIISTMDCSWDIEYCLPSMVRGVPPWVAEKYPNTDMYLLVNTYDELGNKDYETYCFNMDLFHEVEYLLPTDRYSRRDDLETEE